jgi:phosphoglycerate dehydrogenase-like enzyme
MSDNLTDSVLVLPGAAHGVPVEQYVQLLRERLPDHDIQLARSRNRQRELIADARIATGGTVESDLLDHADELQLFACRSAGTNHLPWTDLTERDIAVTNGSGVYGPQVAEHVIGGMLVVTRQFHYGFQRQKRREWQHFEAVGELTGSSVTVVGLGSIGRNVVEKLRGFSVYTIGVRYTPSKGGPTDEVIGFDRDAFQDALARTDYLVVTTPLTDTTRGLVGAAELEALPSDAVLVNVARGGIVDTDALVRALRWNQLGGAVLDVIDPEPLHRTHPLWEFENVVITPHMAGSSPRLWERMADLLVRNIERIETTGGFDDLEGRVWA